MQKDKALIDQCMIHTSTNFERTVLGYPADHRGALLENGEGDLVQEKPCLVSAERCHPRFTKYPWQSMERAWHIIAVWCFFGGLESSFQAFRRFDKDGSGVASICSKHRKRHSMVVVVGFLEAAECRHMCAYLGPGRRRLDEFEMDRKSWCRFLLISC